MEATPALFSCPCGRSSETYKYYIGHEGDNLISGSREAIRTNVKAHLECITCFFERFNNAVVKCTSKGCKYIFEKDIVKPMAETARGLEARAQGVQSTIDSINAGNAQECESKRRAAFAAKRADLEVSGFGGLGQPRPVVSRRQTAPQSTPTSAPDSNNQDDVQPAAPSVSAQQEGENNGPPGALHHVKKLTAPGRGKKGRSRTSEKPQGGAPGSSSDSNPTDSTTTKVRRPLTTASPFQPHAFVSPATVPTAPYRGLTTIPEASTRQERGETTQSIWPIRFSTTLLLGLAAAVAGIAIYMLKYRKR